MKRISVSCTELQDHFYREENGQLTPIYKDTIVDLADYPRSYYPYTDFPCEGLDQEAEDKVYDLIVESELYLPKEDRYSRWNAYNAVLKALWNASSDSSITSSSKENIAEISKKIRLLPNRITDSSALLRSEFSRFIELFEKSHYSENVFGRTREDITHWIVDCIWDDSEPGNPLPFGSPWSVEQLRERPYDYWPEDKIWTWEMFWEAATPIVDEFIKALNYLITLRWIQRQIWKCERANNSSSEPTEKQVEGFEDDSQLTKNAIKKQPPSNQYESFVDLLFSPTDINKYVEALRLVRPERPVINIAGHWIGGTKDGSKSILVAWIERLEDCHKIKKLNNRKVLVRLLNGYFADLCMGTSARIFDDVIDEKIRLAFAALIPK